MARRLALLLLLPLLACRARAEPCPEAATTSTTEPARCAVPGFPDRPFLLHLPPQLDPTTPLPVVIDLHGGGGKAEGAGRLSCPDGDPSDPGCLHALGEREGFAVVYPSGTASKLLELRTWNAGGGEGRWQCVSGRACREGVDELAYFDALLEELPRLFPVDPRRVFVTGMSNGAAMAHRLACERAGRVAAIAPVAGGNQLQAVQGCAPTRAVPVLQIHGREDPCWSWDGGPAACAQRDELDKVSVPDTIAGWVERNGCSATPTVETLPDRDGDESPTRRETYGGCRDGAEVVLLVSEGAGHTWPQGWSYLRERRIGRTTQDVSANEEMWTFFQAHPLPE